MIIDWLTKDGGASQEDPYLEHWIDSLASECHGWPQHIQLYAQQAAGWLKRQEGVLTPDVPPGVLAEARKDRQKYHRGRVTGIEKNDENLGSPAKTAKTSGVEQGDLITALTTGRARAQAETRSDALRRKGIIAENPDKDCIIPVPSMRDWLVNRHPKPKQIPATRTRSAQGPEERASGRAE